MIHSGSVQKNSPYLKILTDDWSRYHANRAVVETAVVELLLLDTDYDRLDLRCRAFSWEDGPAQEAAVVVNGRRVGELTIEGDTELGLGVKNTMDSMDWDDLPPPLRLFLQGLGRVIARLPVTPAG